MKNLITLVGPTAVGKTRLSLRLAAEFNSPVLSADSRQFFRGMDIGTAKPDKEEQGRIKHYFIDSLDPEEVYNAGRFEAEAENLMQELFVKHPILIMVGGSTLYMGAIWQGFDEMPQIEAHVRDRLNQTFEESGLKPLQEELKEVDPATYARIDRQNPARIIRALEVYRGTGIPISLLRKGRKKKIHSYQLIKVGLWEEREKLYHRIDERVEQMMEEGLVNELQLLLERGLSPESQALNTIGYQELIPYIRGKYDLEEAIRLIKRNSRHYAKRQLTYYRKYEDIQWFRAGQGEEALEWIKKKAGDSSPT